MEEIQEKETIAEPEVDSDNSQAQQAEGQAEAPSNLILGKFKSVEDLSKAYQELEKHQGVQSEELGSLRQNSAMLNNITQAWDKERAVKDAEKELREATKNITLLNIFRTLLSEKFIRKLTLLWVKILMRINLLTFLKGMYLQGFLHTRKKMQENPKHRRLQTV